MLKQLYLVKANISESFNSCEQFIFTCMRNVFRKKKLEFFFYLFKKGDFIKKTYFYNFSLSWLNMLCSTQKCCYKCFMNGQHLSMLLCWNGNVLKA